jgi:hypothetical protein
MLNSQGRTGFNLRKITTEVVHVRPLKMGDN